MMVWLAAFALGVIAAALLPLIIFCSSYIVIAVFAAIVMWLRGAASVHGGAFLVLDLIVLQIGYGFGFAALAALKAPKNWGGVREADFEVSERRNAKSALRELLDRRWHNR